jgi:hypothetical protein
MKKPSRQTLNLKIYGAELKALRSEVTVWGTHETSQAG